MNINKHWCATPLDNLEPTESDNGAFIVRDGEDPRVQLKMDAVGVLTVVGLAVSGEAKVNDKHVVIGAGSKALYLVQGSVDLPGRTLQCSDDRVVGQNAKGLYTLTFNNVFVGMPTLLVSMSGFNWDHTDEISSRVETVNNKFTAQITTTDNSRNLASRPFTFIAIGPV